MKLLKLWIMLTLSAGLTYAQDTLTATSYFNGLSINANTYNLNPGGFFYGWNWASIGAKLDEALMINLSHTGYSPTDGNVLTHLFRNGTNLILSSGLIAGGDRNYSITQAQALLYEPALTVDTTRNFQPIENDRTGAVFGFKYRHPDFVDDQDMDHLFVLRESVLDNLQLDEALVLNNIWPQNEIYTRTIITITRLFL